MNELIESANKPQDRSREFPATLNRMTMEMQHSATNEEDRWTQSYLHFNSYLPDRPDDEATLFGIGSA